MLHNSQLQLWNTTGEAKEGRHLYLLFSKRNTEVHIFFVFILSDILAAALAALL